MIRLAPVYVTAYPLRGRPRKPLFRGRRPFGIDACTPRTKSAGYHSLGTWSRPLETRDRDYGLPPAACVESGAVCGSWV
jgi:hypothetical protein